MHSERCPVCSGNGLVDNGFYRQTAGDWASSSAMPEKCRSCDGRGWVTVGDPVDVRPILFPRDGIGPEVPEHTFVCTNDGAFAKLVEVRDSI